MSETMSPINIDDLWAFKHQNNHNKGFLHVWMWLVHTGNVLTRFQLTFWVRKREILHLAIYYSLFMFGNSFSFVELHTPASIVAIIIQKIERPQSIWLDLQKSFHFKECFFFSALEYCIFNQLLIHTFELYLNYCSVSHSTMYYWKPLEGFCLSITLKLLF